MGSPLAAFEIRLIEAWGEWSLAEILRILARLEDDYSGNVGGFGHQWLASELRTLAEKAELVGSDDSCREKPEPKGGG